MLTEPAAAYHDLKTACASIDTRETAYRFDAEQDIPWQRLSQSGAYFGRELLAKVGFDVQSLREHGRALQILEWSLALATCRAFELVKQIIVDFSEEHESTLSSRSQRLRDEDERKHIAVFRRYGDHLARQHPIWAERFDELHASHLGDHRVNVRQATYPSQAAHHFTFWLNTLFFEEFTMYFSQLLEECTEEVQPVWLALHRAHRREEAHHVLIGTTYLRDIKLDDAGRSLWTKYFYFRLERELETFLGLDVVRQMVLEFEPDAAAVLGTKRVVDSELFTDIFKHDAFQQTRRHAPSMIAHEDVLLPVSESLVPMLAETNSERRSVSHLASRRLIIAPGKDETLVDALCRAIDTNPDAGVVLVEGAGKTRQITYAELLERAESMLSGLRSRGVAKGDVCLIPFETDLACLAAFWGCLLGGIKPAIVAPRLACETQEDFALRLSSIWEGMQRPMMVALPELAQRLPEMMASVTGGAIAQCLSTADLVDGVSPVEMWSPSHPHESAVIIFGADHNDSSRGVCLTHQNMLCTAAGVVEHRGGSWADVFCGGMPLHRETGLIGFHLTPVIAAATQVLIEPEHFMIDAHLWLKVLDNHRVTITALQAEAIETLLIETRELTDATFDLSSVRLLMCGSENIRTPQVTSLVKTLECFGLSADAFCPAYGVLEATLAVTMWAPGAVPRIRYFERASLGCGMRVAEVSETDADAVAMVDQGSVIAEWELRVVDADRATVREGVVGRILVRGPGVFSAYYGRPNATNLAKQGTWLNTGDIGFVLGGRLFVCGRSQDVLVVRGQIFHSQDLETALQNIPGLGSKRVAVTGWLDEEAECERMVVFAEPHVAVGPARDELRVEIASTLNWIVGRVPDEIVWSEQATFQRTTSGRLLRERMRRAYLVGQYDE